MIKNLSVLVFIVAFIVAAFNIPIWITASMILFEIGSLLIKFEIALIGLVLWVIMGLIIIVNAPIWASIVVSLLFIGRILYINEK